MSISLPFCYIEVPGEIGTKRREHLKNAVYQVSELNPFMVAFVSKHPIDDDLVELIDLCHHYNITFSRIISDCGPLKKSIAEQLKQAGLSRIQINLYGKTQSKVTEVSVENALASAAISINSKIHTSIRAFVTSENHEEIPELFEKAVEINANEFILHRLVHIDKPHLRNLIVAEKLKYKQLYLKLIGKEKENARIELQSADPFKFLMLYPEKIPKFKIRARRKQAIPLGCPAGTHMIYVRSNGNVWPCPHLDSSIGNIEKVTLSDLLRTSPIIHLFKDRSLLKGRCGSCEYKEICGGCRAAAKSYYGDILAEDPACWLS